MKIIKLFHWLYASVMMLPLVVAPVYAIFMHRHQTTEYTFTKDVPIIESVDFNQLADFNIVDNQNANLEVTKINGQSYSLNGTASSSNVWFNGFYSSTNTIFTFKANHKYYGYNFRAFNYHTAIANFDNNSIVSFSSDVDVTAFRIRQLSGSYDNYVINFQLFDLTQMFGVGNEPTIVDFDSLFTYQPYSYVISDYQSIVIGTDTITYDDTDIGSQFIYAIYLPLDKYFNVTSFLGLNNLYAWINTNVFNGVAPLGFSLFYMLLSYWLLVSIFWLVFDLVMYVPNLAHKWLDKASID